MNKEFPFDRWFRRHVTPGRFTLAIILLIAFVIFGSLVIPATIGLLCYILLATILVITVPITVWQIYWHIKYPPQIEFCKECGRAKPIKYED